LKFYHVKIFSLCVPDLLKLTILSDDCWKSTRL